MNEDRTYEAWLDETKPGRILSRDPRRPPFPRRRRKFWPLILTLVSLATGSSEAILGIIKKFCRKFVI